MTRRGSRLALRWLQWTLVLAGVLCASWLFVSWRGAAAYQRAERALLMQATRTLPVASLPPLPSLRPDESVVGLLEVPRLGVSVVAAEGDDDVTLQLAAGHLPDTPFPWEPGNSSFAGHRDTFFRALRRLRIGDEIRMVTARGTFDYRVSRTVIVGPHEVSVLHPDDGTALTLITCYPFTYVGPAPRRFIVQAERVDSPAPRALSARR